MIDLPIVEVKWGDAWIDTKDYTFEEAKKLSPVIRKTIGYLINTTEECIVLATDLYKESKSPEIEGNTINTPMIIPWGMVIEWYELTF
tara:strand:+ start:15754 stop:16017 length:264 start_codon:yes stop_codon:yes gene_type:complete